MFILTVTHDRFDCGSDHALLQAVLQFGKQPKVRWSYQEAVLYDLGEEFSEYQTSLDTFASSIPIDQFSMMTSEEMLPHVSESINQAAMKSFELKV